jgi:ubiquinone/menaquinone biosynthesis C-methylase UbiE
LVDSTPFQRLAVEHEDRPAIVVDDAQIAVQGSAKPQNSLPVVPSQGAADNRAAGWERGGLPDRQRLADPGRHCAIMGRMDGQASIEARQGGHLERFDPGEQGGKLIDAEHRGRYWWAAQIAAGKDVLDAGCGTGYGAQILQMAGAASLTAVDISSEAVAATAGRVSPADVVRADLRDLPLEDDSFDLVVCWEVIEHVDEGERAISELRRVLKPSGILLVSSPNPDVYPSGNEHHVHEYRATELTAMVGECFSHLSTYGQHPWLASVIEAREKKEPGSGENSVRTHTTRAIGKLAAGNETYALIAASDEPLPSLPDLITLGSDFEVRWWQDQLASIEKLVARAEARELDAVRQFHEVSDALLEANQALAQVPVLSHRVEELTGVVKDIEGSISWRLTAPLRRLRRVGRS